MIRGSKPILLYSLSPNRFQTSAKDTNGPHLISYKRPTSMLFVHKRSCFNGATHTQTTISSLADYCITQATRICI